MLKININIYSVLIILICPIIFYIVVNKLLRLRRSGESKKKILEKKVPGALSEAKLYEQIIENNKDDENIAALGRFLLFKYYKNSSKGDKDLISKSIEYGEEIRKKYRGYAFHEDAMFMLGNIYFFETFEFN